MTVSNSKDTNQASEELREMFKAFVDSGYHACYCPRSVDNGCECAIKDEYVDKVMTAINALIHTEKLKLLGKVRGRVVGEDVEPHHELCIKPEKYCVCSNGTRNDLRKKQQTELAKLEAEL